MALQQQAAQHPSPNIPTDRNTAQLDYCNGTVTTTTTTTTTNTTILIITIIVIKL